jgi:hypothetical protein
MKITCRANAFVVEEGSDGCVAAPRGLGEWSYQEDRLEGYLDAAIADQGVVGGIIRASVTEEGASQILVEYWSPAPLDQTTVDSLRRFTTAQLEDGIGEGGFQVIVEGQRLLLVPDLQGPVEVEQTDDGIRIQPPCRIAMAARDGNESALRDALSTQVEDVDATHQGYTGLHFALLYGHVDAALLLIAHGADVKRTDRSGNSPLDLCALSNSLSDDDSAALARALQSNGADPSRIGPTGITPRGLAEMRGKRLMAGATPLSD